MKPKRIFLIRHGESEGNVDTYVYNHTPDWVVPLTDRGRQQAACMAEKLDKIVGECRGDNARYAFLYCSPWVRARQTADPIRKKFNIEQYYEDPRLREQEWGNFREEGLALKIEKERYKFGTFFYRMPYGESGADVYDRMSTFLETLHRDFKKEEFPDNAIIVSHGLTIKTFLMRWFHWSVEEFDVYKTPRNCEALRMELQGDGKYRLMTPLRVRPKEELSPFEKCVNGLIRHLHR